MHPVSNQFLYEKKLNALKKFYTNFNSHKFEHDLSCSYHGVPLRFHSSKKFKTSLENYVPSNWLIEQSHSFEIYLLPPEHFSCSLEQWADESSQDCYSLEKNTIAIQRDFASWIISSSKILLVCEDSVSDGFHNFLRWFLSERLISNNKYVIHASCVLDKNNLAHIFLGHSGAGKTTITKLSSPRLTLGDDMNIISFENAHVEVEAGAIGGLFNSMIGYDKKVKVKAFYWLTQARENKLLKYSKMTAHQKLLASFANLHWETLPASTADLLIEFSLKASGSTDFYELQFKNDSSVWEMLDP